MIRAQSFLIFPSRQLTCTAARIGTIGPKAALTYGNGRASAVAVIMLAAKIKFAIQSAPLLEDGFGWAVAWMAVEVVDMRVLSANGNLSDSYPHRIPRRRPK
jgi:hypothetical protein